ncbi:MAG: hypothetical protein ACRD1V_17445 [Vicinamibacterales bacterium]
MSARLAVSLGVLAPVLVTGALWSSPHRAAAPVASAAPQSLSVIADFDSDGIADSAIFNGTSVELTLS